MREKKQDDLLNKYLDSLKSKIISDVGSINLNLFNSGLVVDIKQASLVAIEIIKQYRSVRKGVQNIRKK